MMGAVADAAPPQAAGSSGEFPGGLVARGPPPGRAAPAGGGATRPAPKPSGRARSRGLRGRAGGYGTLDELFEAVTWGQLGIHRKPIGLLDVEGYFAPLVAFLTAIAEGFVRPEYRGLLLVGTDPVHLLDALADHAPPAMGEGERKVRSDAPRPSAAHRTDPSLSVVLILHPGCSHCPAPTAQSKSGS